ncbi:hypothetical protein [Occultella gossypii]|uniref:Integral membrane protein n=1 Tax=Occultella gossypii TaxID=2800820 RepID=A0ABS7S7G7_9MICO|nr:hypothetical protein [Occultella gossypii]MBZ2196205.1 hypothetical protein [Occultella gossypii]
MITTELPSASTLAGTLRRLYLGRFGFAVVWALLVALVSPGSDALLTVLLVLYPMVDAASVYVETRASGSSSRSRLSERANIVLSVLAALALGWAAFNSVAAVLTVWGVWAVVSGATQLLTGVSRRRLGGQWPADHQRWTLVPRRVRVHHPGVGERDESGLDRRIRDPRRGLLPRLRHPSAPYGAGS